MAIILSHQSYTHTHTRMQASSYTNWLRQSEADKEKAKERWLSVSCYRVRRYVCTRAHESAQHVGDDDE